MAHIVHDAPEGMPSATHSRVCLPARLCAHASVRVHRRCFRIRRPGRGLRWRQTARPPDTLRSAALGCGRVDPCATAAMDRPQAEVEFRAVVIDVGCEYVRYSKLGALCDREPIGSTKANGV